MIITPIASSSLGNAYILDDEKGLPLLLEAGVSFKKLQIASGFRLSSFGGALISHSHLDHCRAVHDLIKAGIDCYMTAPTAKAIELAGHRVKIIEPLKQFNIGNWKILPFSTQHDCEGSVGFLLANGESKVCFATDTAYLKFRFSGITHLMIEANYDNEILNKNVENGSVTIERKARLIKSHFSLKNLVEMLKANDWSRLQECWLMHLSKENSNEMHFKRVVQEILGKPVYVCKEKI